MDAVETATQGPPKARLRKQYQDFVSLKAAEGDERQSARLYYHMSQWTREQLAELKRRGQPVVTSPLFPRKLNSFVGLLERMRRDPKAYPRTPKEEAGAELATASLRYAMDAEQWRAKSPICVLDGCLDGIGVIEIGLKPGDPKVPGDMRVTISRVDPADFFYDPRSFAHDFSDARFMGVAKWVDIDDAVSMFPDKEADIRALKGDSSASWIDDKSVKWTNSTLGQVRMVEHWYRVGERWRWCFYIGEVVLDSGESYLRDDEGNDMCRFEAWSAFIDQDGDRYGFHRLLKSLVDEVNQRGAKALHLLASRRVIYEKGAFTDAEKMRRDNVRADAMIEINPTFFDKVRFEDQKNLADMQGQLAMKQAAEAAIESFGPNPALVGGSEQAKSGRHYALVQQAGIAELGPFITAYDGWKLRVYRKVWRAIAMHWKAQRWIRVTDQEGLEQAILVNGIEIDPVTGQPVWVNAVGQLDVDIIIDEGPDVINLQADALETLQSAMSNGVPIPPEALFDLLPLPDSQKRRLLGTLTKAQEPDPARMEAQRIELARGMAEIEETRASTQLKLAQAGRQQVEARMKPIETARQINADMMGAARGMQDAAPQIQPQLPF